MLGFGGLGLGFSALGLGFGGLGLGAWGLGFGVRVSGSGFRVSILFNEHSGAVKGHSARDVYYILLGIVVYSLYII